MKESTFELIKKFLMGIFFAVILVIFLTLLVLTMDDKFIKDVKKFIKTDTKVLYISNSKNYNKYPSEILDKYEINYMYINSNKLSNFQKSKIQNIINNKDLSNIIVVFESGKIKDAILSYESNDELNEFLMKNDVIPNIMSNISGMISKIENSIKSDSLILYLPYKYDENIEYQDNLIKNISKQYNLDYKRIDIFLLSNTQKQKVNSILNISDVEDQIILFIKNKEIIGTLRGYNRRYIYINKLFEYGYIEEKQNNLNELTYDEFEYLLESDDKSIVLITKDDCKYCKETMDTLNQISILNDLDIQYINIPDMDSDIAIKIENKLKKMGYSDGFSTPITIVVEKKKLLDYSIGSSSSDFFQDMFKECGIIK